MEATQISITCRFGLFFLLQLCESVPERWFRCIHPPGIHAHIIESFLEVLPEDIPCNRIIGIKNLITRPCRFAKQCTDRIQRLIDSRFRSESGPYGKHKMNMVLLMQFINNLTGMIKVCRMESQAVPMRFVSPIFPILHNVIQRNSPFTVFFNDCLQFIERLITFFGLPETIHPFSKHRHVPRQFPITGNDFVHILAIDKIIVGSITYFGSK